MDFCQIPFAVYFDTGLTYLLTEAYDSSVQTKLINYICEIYLQPDLPKDNSILLSKLLSHINSCKYYSWNILLSKVVNSFELRNSYGAKTFTECGKTGHRYKNVIQYSAEGPQRGMAVSENNLFVRSSEKKILVHHGAEWQYQFFQKKHMILREY